MGGGALTTKVLVVSFVVFVKFSSILFALPYVVH